jgi:hypothetical protein
MTTQVKKVSTIEPQVAKNGTEYYKVTWEGGAVDNIFDRAHFATLSQAAESGQSVTVVKEQNPKNDKYWNVKSIILGGERAVVPPAAVAAAVRPPAAAPPPVQPPTTRRDDSIEAQSDMKAAIETLRLVTWPPGTKLGVILKLIPITYQIIKRTRRGEIEPADEDVLAVMMEQPKAEKKPEVKTEKPVSKDVPF